MGLYDYCAAVLGNAQTLWGAAWPDLAYVAEGLFETLSADCEQAVVELGQLNRGDPGNPDLLHVPVGGWSAVVNLSIWRECMATSETEAPPPAADHGAAAAVTMGDLDLMWRNVNTIFNVGRCVHFGIVGATLLPVEGAIGGSRITISVDLLRSTL